MANKSSSRSKGWKQKSGWRSSSPAGDSQSSQEHWTKADKKETRLREVTKKSTEQMKDKRASWSESLKASQKREDELATQTADSLAVTKKGTGRKKNLELPSTPGFGCVMKPR